MEDPIDAFDRRTHAIDRHDLARLIAARPAAHCGEQGILFDLGTRTLPLAAIRDALDETANGPSNGITDAYGFLRILKTNIDHYLLREPVPGIGPRDGAVFADWMLLRTSPRVAHDTRTLDAYLGTLIDALARHADLASLWRADRRISGTAPLVLLDGEEGAFVYASERDRRLCLFTPQGAGEIAATLPGAHYSIAGIPRMMRQHSGDLRALLLGVEHALSDEMSRAGSDAYPHKTAARPARWDA